MPGMTLQEFVASLPSEHEEFCVLTTDEILEWAARERMLEKAVEVAVTYHADGMIAKAEEERLPVLAALCQPGQTLGGAVGATDGEEPC